jgi:acyl-coenzyme A synthetase/AMP-(fatty) acid ligase
VNSWRRTKAAIVWEGEPGDVRTLTYGQLHGEVCRFANALTALGVGKGDRVAIYMPMIPELPIAMLACARIGAPHSVVFGGFSAEALRDRIEDVGAKLVVTADGGYRRGAPYPLKPAVDAALRGVRGVAHVVVVRRTGEPTEMSAGRDVWWHDAVRGRSTACKPAVLDAEHPLFVLYTSGSTGKPKGNPAHHGRLPHARHHDREGDLRPEGRRHLLVYCGLRMGHRPFVRRLRDPRERRHHADVRGRAHPSRARSLLGHHRAPPRQRVLYGTYCDPHLHPARRRTSREARPVVAASARLRR